MESSGIFAPEGSELRIVTINSESESAPTALRFLKTGDNPKLMQYINGAWKAIPFTENGSTAFCVSGNAFSPVMIIKIAMIAAVVIIAVTVILVLINKNKFKKKQKQLNRSS